MLWSKLLAGVTVMLVASASLAQTPSYKNVGRTPTKEEIQVADISIGPDGRGLPPGQGTSKEGAAVYAAKCAVCHGPEGEGGQIGPRLISTKADIESLTTIKPARIIGAYWAYATTIWDFTYRAMPRNQGRTLSANEVYALTAFILAKSGIIQEGDVMDAKSLPEVQMPNRNGFIPQNFSDIPDEKKRGCFQGVCP